MMNETAGWVMMKVSLGNQAPSISNVAKIMDLPETAINSEFGVTIIDQEKGVFAVMVRSDAIAESVDLNSQVEGPFSNPKIEPLN